MTHNIGSYIKEVLPRLVALTIICITIRVCYTHFKVNTGIQSNDTIWNEYVRDTFYTARLGEPTSTVIKKLESHGFYQRKDIDDNQILRFQTCNDSTFFMSGLPWSMLNIITVNGHCTGIMFLRNLKSKAEALSYFNDLKYYVGREFSLTNIAVNDTSVYACSYAFGKNKVNARIMYGVYEDYYENKQYGVQYFFSK